MASRMGLPAKGFTVATNQNDLLFRLFNEGLYRPSVVKPSLAPSMDIQVASNFERFLYYHLNGNGEKTLSLMKDIKEGKEVIVPDFDPGLFSATRTNDLAIQENIRHSKNKFNYIPDPHTCLLYTSPSPRDLSTSRMPSSA